MTNHTERTDYHILNTPGLSPDRTTRRTSEASGLVGLLSRQKLRSKELSVEVIRQLLNERQGLRDKNKSRILGEIADVSSDISCCENQRYSPDARDMKLKLAKQKADMESLLREEDVSLWKDTEELRRLLIEADKAHESAKLRADLLASVVLDEDKGANHAENPG